MSFRSQPSSPSGGRPASPRLMSGPLGASSVVSVVRIRPLSGSETARREAPVLRVSGNAVLLDRVALEREGRAEWLADTTFAFDRVFDPTNSTQHVYAAAAPLIASMLDGGTSSELAGTNVTLLAFGQTASGKTHSMIGTPDAPGIMVLAAEDLLTRVRTRARATARASFQANGGGGLGIGLGGGDGGGFGGGGLVFNGGGLCLRASCCEVHNEQCNDLLAPGANLRLYETPSGIGPAVESDA